MKLSVLFSAVWSARINSKNHYVVNEPLITGQSNITYNGHGPVMANGINIYAIFYGNHSSKTQSIVQRFVEHLGKSDWWTTTMSYYGSNGHISDSVKWAGAIHDDYSHGTTITDLEDVIYNAIENAKWPYDVNGIYVVFGDSSTTERSSWSGSSCDQYCGYHSIIGGNLKTAYIQDGTKCPGTLPPPGQTVGTGGCMQRYWRNQTDTSYSVNGDQSGDNMVNVLAHEITEAASNYANSWMDSNSYENADKCNRYMMDLENIGDSDPYDGVYNAVFGDGSKYLIQANWSPILQACVMKEGAVVKPVAETLMDQLSDDLPR